MGTWDQNERESAEWTWKRSAAFHQQSKVVTSKPCLGEIKTSEEQKYAHSGYGSVTVCVTCASFYTAVVVPVLLTPVSLMETNPEEKSCQQKGVLLKD